MKLAVSNIAWYNSELEEHLELLQHLGCDGVELAPSCIWPEPIEVSDKDIEQLKRLLNKYNLVIPAFHALFYTRPDLYLFGDRSVRVAALDYLERTIELSTKLSVKALIYGSPKSRRVGNKNYDECYSIAVDMFRKLAKKAKKYGTCICIEPLGPSESDFIQNSEEGYKLVSDVNSPGFGLHLDAKAMVETNDDFCSVFKKYGKFLKHFHVNDAGLSPPGYTGFDHSIIGKALRESSYDGFVSIEMKKILGQSRVVIKNAVDYVRKNYFL